MNEGCRAFEARRADAHRSDAASQAAWGEHVQVCASCQEQEAADRALRGLLAGARRPDLPPFFAQRCASRARLAPSARPLGVRERGFLRAYWVLTAIVAVVVLVRVAWSFNAAGQGRPQGFESLAAIPPVVGAAAAMSLAAVLTPILLLAQFRGGLFALLRRLWGHI
jgi:hypothetical protein